MRKILIIFLLLFLCSCTKSENNDNNLYYKYVKELENVNIENTVYPFNVDIELRYVLCVDEFQESVKDLEVMVIHDQKSTDIFPSIGILDEKININDKKGILLIGYFEYKKDINVEFKSIIKYKNENSEEKIFYFIKKSKIL